MTDNNLFLSLRKYSPRRKMDPIENFLTEAFAWILHKNQGLASIFLKSLQERWDIDSDWPLNDEVEWRTQEQVNNVRLDMVADLGTHAFIFEHKVWSSLHDGQLDKYREYAAEKWQNFCIVLITGSSRQHQQSPDVAITWSDVYEIIKGWHNKMGSSADLVDDFLEFLREEGLGTPDPVSHESILSYLPGQKPIPRLKGLIHEAGRQDWEWFYKRLAWPGQSRKPYLRKYGNLVWSRMGLELLKGWRPGVFVGVMLDGKDHKIKLSNPHLGPDFCLIFSFYHDKPGVPERKEYLDSKEYSNLCNRLEKDAAAQDWDFLNHFDSDINPNPWHLLHLRRPLLSVLKGTINLEDQLKRFMKASEEGIELLLDGGELETLQEQFSKNFIE